MSICFQRRDHRVLNKSYGIRTVSKWDENLLSSGKREVLLKFDQIDDSRVYYVQENMFSMSIKKIERRSMACEHLEEFLSAVSIYR